MGAGSTVSVGAGDGVLGRAVSVVAAGAVDVAGAVGGTATGVAGAAQPARLSARARLSRQDAGRFVRLSAGKTRVAPYSPSTSICAGSVT